MMFLSRRRTTPSVMNPMPPSHPDNAWPPSAESPSGGPGLPTPQPPQYLPALSWGLSRDAYTPWHTRVAAFLIDVIPAAVMLAVGWILQQYGGDCAVIRRGTPVKGYCRWAVSSSGQFTTTGRNLITLALILALVLWALAVAYWIWNLGYRQGKTGSSIGKSVMKFKVVSQKTWQPIGFGRSVVRQIAHYMDQQLCFIGYLWPIWDPERQTIADKIVGTVCVPLNQSPILSYPD
jgi:uncharacterized RDD family membrane protein YckC